MKKIIVLVFSLFILINSLLSQTPTTWNGKGCAVVLTYDDALNIDLTHVVPALDSSGLKGTFYISDYFGGLRKQIPAWRKAAAEGHELANHTVYHPCIGSLPGRSFVSADYDLDHYSLRRIKDEINTMNTLLHAIDSKTERTFAFPCGDTKIHDTSYIDQMKSTFLAARGVQPEMYQITKIDLYNIGCYSMNGQSGDQMIQLVQLAMKSHSLLVLLFHGVGGEHSLNVSLAAHNQLLEFLHQNKKEIWVAPLIDVVSYIKNNQQH